MAESSPMPTETRDNAAARAPHPLDSYLSLLKPLTIGLAAVLLAFAFLKLGGEVAEGDTHSFDTRLLHAAQALRAEIPWFADVMRDLSGLGSMVVLSLFTVATVGYLALVRARVTAILVATSVTMGSVFVSLLKNAFGRLRPDTAFSEVMASGLSFPSGHTSMSAIVFLTLGALIASTRTRLRERAYILAGASVLTLLVGVSRVALGVHWATDVLGGWAFGAAWATAWLLLARQVARRR
jgi:undecaprenyl-diphosphatase